MEDLKRLKSWHENLIFDDITFNHIPRAETVIHLLDGDYHATIRVLRGTVKIRPKIKKWFTHNSEGFIYPVIATPEQKDAIDRRLTTYKVTSRREIENIINGSLTTDRPVGSDSE